MGLNGDKKMDVGIKILQRKYKKERNPYIRERISMITELNRDGSRTCKISFADLIAGVKIGSGSFSDCFKPLGKEISLSSSGIFFYF